MSHILYELRNPSTYKRALCAFLKAVLFSPRTLFRYVNARPLRYFTGFFAFLLAWFMLLIPSAYVVEEPGPTQDVLGKSYGEPVITVTGLKKPVDEDPGKLLLLTVDASGVPGYEVPTVSALLAWNNPRSAITPVEAVVPAGQDADAYEKESNDEMNTSQSSAQDVALEYARKKLGISTDGVKVKLHIDEIGGPSGGMMYTLGILDKLTDEHETGGKIIAGTGTIDKSLKIGAIGGIRLKMLGALRDGATWFLAPYDNCDEVVGHVPSGLKVVSVNTLDDAWKALKAIGSGKGTDKLPTCKVY